MFNIGPQELLLILLVALVVVGPKRLPELSRTIGRGLREFRKAQDEVKKTINLGLDESEPTRPRTGTGRAASAGSSVPAEQGAGTTAGGDTDQQAGEPTDGAADVARTLGRGLAEIRRARREIQRNFRVDLTDEPPMRPGTAGNPPVATPPVATPPAETVAEPPPDPPAGPGTPA